MIANGGHRHQGQEVRAAPAASSEHPVRCHSSDRSDCGHHSRSILPRTNPLSIHSRGLSCRTVGPDWEGTCPERFFCRHLTGNSSRHCDHHRYCLYRLRTKPSSLPIAPSTPTAPRLTVCAYRPDPFPGHVQKSMAYCHFRPAAALRSAWYRFVARSEVHTLGRPVSSVKAS